MDFELPVEAFKGDDIFALTPLFILTPLFMLPLLVRIADVVDIDTFSDFPLVILTLISART
jgi:hypothetical protein